MRLSTIGRVASTPVRGTVAAAMIVAALALAVSAGTATPAEAYAKRPNCATKGMICAYHMPWFQSTRRGVGCGEIRQYGGIAFFGDLAGDRFSKPPTPSRVSSIYNGCEFAIVVYEQPGAGSRWRKIVLAPGGERGTLPPSLDNVLGVVRRA